MSLVPLNLPLLTALLCPALLITPVQAQELGDDVRSRYETTGVFGGAAAGAVLGGPPGVVLGAVAGGWFSDQILTRKENRLLKAHLEQTRQELLALQENNARLQMQLSAAHQSADSGSRQLASNTLYPAGLNTSFTEGAGYMAFTGSELVLHFRTGSAEIETHYRRNLADFARAASLISDPEVEILGYADRRGEEAANLELSQQRVQAVEKALRGLRLNDVTWKISANGEQEPLSDLDALENNFFDRRVVLRVHPRNTALLSRNEP